MQEFEEVIDNEIGYNVEGKFEQEVVEDEKIPKENIEEGAEQTNTDTQEKSCKFNIKKEVIIEYIKRYAFLLVGLFIMSFGVALSIKAALGTSPISSVPYVINIISGLSIGVTTIIVNTIIVLLQIVILRKKFKWINLIQIPVCVVFGLLCDLAVMCVGGIVLTAYWQQWLICIAGIILVALGVSMEVTANVMTLAGEGLTLALCQVLPIKFGFMKVIVDVTLVLLAVVISFIFLHKLAAVREGTAAAALCVGLLAKQFNRFIKPLGDKIFYPKREKDK